MAISKIKSGKATIKTDYILAQSGDLVVFSYRQAIVGFDLNGMKQSYKKTVKWRMGIEHSCTDQQSFYGYYLDKGQLVIEARAINTGKVNWKTRVKTLELETLPFAYIAVNGTQLLICFDEVSLLLHAQSGSIVLEKQDCFKNWGIKVAANNFFIEANQSVYLLDDQLNPQLCVAGGVYKIFSSDKYIYCLGDFDGHRESLLLLDAKSGEKLKHIIFNPTLSSPCDLFPMPKNPNKVAITLHYGPIIAMVNVETEKVDWINGLNSDYDFEDSYHGSQVVYSDLGLAIKMWSMGRDEGAYVLCDPKTGKEIYTFFNLGTSAERDQLYIAWKNKLVEIGEKEVNLYGATTEEANAQFSAEYLKVYNANKSG